MDRAGRWTRAIRTLGMPALVLLGLSLASCNGGSSRGSTPNPGAPVVTSVAPGVGPFSGGTVLTIRGSNFQTPGGGPNTVRVGGKLASNVVTVDDATILASTPIGTPGMKVDIQVQNSLGTGRLHAGFSYLVPAAVLSDLDGDGIADMVVGAPTVDAQGPDSGAVYVFRGSDQPGGLVDRSASAADFRLTGEAAGDAFGMTVAVGDIDGDGQDDLAVGAPLHNGGATDSGAVYVFYGPLTSPVTGAAAASFKLTGDDAVAGDRFGASISCGDVDGDDRADLMIGATRADVPAPGGAMSDAGCVYLFSGGSNVPSMNARQASTAFGGLTPGARLGNAVACGDVDADGVGDVMVASYLADPFLPPLLHDAGAVYTLCSANGLAGRTVDQADALYTGEAERDEFGTCLTSGDVDGDGVLDMIVGTPLNDALGSNVGRVYLFNGASAMGPRRASEADTYLTGQPTNDTFGQAVTIGDMNGDGLEDVVIGAPMASFTHNGSGRAFVYFGEEGMRDRVATGADVIYNGEPLADDRCGSLVRVADVNRDGMADVLVSAPGNDAGGPGAGRVYLFLGGQTIGGQRSATADDATLTGSESGGMFGSAIADGQ